MQPRQSQGQPLGVAPTMATLGENGVMMLNDSGIFRPNRIHGTIKINDSYVGATLRGCPIFVNI